MPSKRFNPFGFLAPRGQRKTDQPAQGSPPIANTPAEASDNGLSPAPASDQSNELEGAREMARAMLADETFMRHVTPEGREAMSGLLAPEPTPEQVAQGIRAVRSITQAVGQAMERDTLLQSLPEPLVAWYQTPSWLASRQWLAEHLAELPTDAPATLEGAAQRASAAGHDRAATTLQRHAELLRQARSGGVDAAYQAIIGAEAFGQPSRSGGAAEGMSESQVALTRADVERGVDDPAFLAERLGLPPGDPHIASIQAELRQMLAGNQSTASVRRVASEDIMETLVAWLNTSPADAQRRYLEQHRELIASDVALQQLEQGYRERAETQLAALRPSLDAIKAQHTALPDDLWSRVQDYDETMNALAQLGSSRHLLDDIRREGGDTPAIAHAYVDARGGLALDLPAWLDELLDRLAVIPAKRASDVAQRVALLQSAIEQAYARGDVAAEAQAALLETLALALVNQAEMSADPRPMQEAAIAALDEALVTYTLDRYPKKYADLQTVLGNLLRERAGGSRRENLERAIAAYEQALRGYTPDRYSQQRATIQNNLGVAYRNRITGEKRENIERAIAAYEQALKVRTLERYPQDYGMTQNNLGAAYNDRAEGERRENLERAIAAYEQALIVRTLERYPIQHANTQNNLGNVYCDRILGEKRDNLERAIACYERALVVRTLDSYPQDYAMIQNNLGTVYNDRIVGDRRDNLERAIACYEQALLVRTAERFPQQFANTQINLGNAYRRRLGVDKSASIERAIECYKQALSVSPIERFPDQYADAQHDLGIAYSERIAGDRDENLGRAIGHYEQALLIRTLERNPLDYANTQNSLGLVAADRGDWPRAAAAFEATLEAQNFMLALSGSIVGRDLTLERQGGAATRAAYAHMRAGDDVAAALAIEHGRARGLAETQRLQAGDPQRIGDLARRARYVEARAALSQAQITLNLPITNDELTEALRAHSISQQTLPEDEESQQQVIAAAQREIEFARSAAFQRAKATFNTVVDDVRAASDPADFLLAPLSLADLYRAAACGGAGHALCYIGRSKWGGLAVIAFAADPASGRAARVETLQLPGLTTAAITDLIERPLASGDARNVSGYGYAQEGNGFALLLRDWPGETLRERARALHLACREAGVASTLDAAVQRAMLTLGAHAEYARLIDAPLDSLAPREMGLLNSCVSHLFLRIELTRGLATMADIALRPLADALSAQDVHSVTLIPCGEVAAYPLAAAEIAPGITFGDRFPASVAPSARSLLRDEAAHAHAHQGRAGVATVGDPRVTHQPLQWGEAEALTVAHLARALGLSAEARAQQQATRDWLLSRFADTLLVDASCHGVFNAREPLDSYLALAGATTPTPLTLRELLNQGVEGRGLLFGLRLLILSACQTGILDLRGAQDEMRSMTAAVLEAGADAAMGALWSVDDKATYLLVVRFAQLWLPQMESLAPAIALAQAQRWLRTVTNAQLRAWRHDHFPEPTAEEKRAAGCAESERDPWRDEEQQEQQAAASARLIAVRGPGDRLADLDDDSAYDAGGAERGARQERYDPQEAQSVIQSLASRASDDDACPYAHPYYWAAFQVNGW